ncbi:MAG TPA: group III truncated hemoglobin [Pseudomonadales bacterium]|nr:group III truncated hemoglobin [Pseudomonadales bacterium]
MKPDLDSKEHIAEFLQQFYGKLLNDPVLAPIFLDVAGIDLRVHLGHIQAYWEKLLLGEDNYRRHTMNIHRALHGKRALTEAEFDRWLDFYICAVDENFSGAQAEKAKRIAEHIADNMKTRIVRDLFDTNCQAHNATDKTLDI